MWVEALRFATVAGALVLGAIATIPLASQVSVLAGWDERTGQIITFFVISILLEVLLIPVRRALVRVFTQHTVRLWNQIVSGALGFGSGVLLAGMLAWALSLIPAEYLHRSVLERSLTGPYVVQAVQCVVQLVPAGRALRW